MSKQIPLIIPMTVEAFVVNDHVRQSPNFYLRMPMEYNAIQYGYNGQANQGGNDTNFSAPPTKPVPPSRVCASKYYNGVYLKWRLPYALTHGVQDEFGTTFPPVPNRWLIVRYGGTDTATPPGTPTGERLVTAWIVESDYVWPCPPVPPWPQNASQDGSMYITPASSTDPTPVATKIGRNVRLDQWSESVRASLGLTAVAPGNPSFAAYQPHCNNVFSFIDSLEEASAQTLSYAVYGWYSNPKDDPLNGVEGDGSNFAQVVEKLGWSTAPSQHAATCSLLSGAVTGVAWTKDEKPKGGAPSSPISIAVGNTSVEALTALITAQAGTSVDSELLEAFQLDLIDLLDQPDGASLLAERLHTSFFHKFSGGYTWSIVDAPNSNTPVTAEELTNESALLQTLNNDQIALDSAIATLASLQAELYTIWWKSISWNNAYVGSPGTLGLSLEYIQNRLQPTLPGSIASQTSAQMTLVQSKQAEVPSGSTPEKLQQAITSYAKNNGLPPNRVLKRTAAPRYFAPNNPVVLIAGAGASGIVVPDRNPQCRFPSQLVTGFKFNGGKHHRFHTGNLDSATGYLQNFRCSVGIVPPQ